MKTTLEGKNVVIHLDEGHTVDLYWRDAESLYQAMSHFLNTGNSCQCGTSAVAATHTQDRISSIQLKAGTWHCLAEESSFKSLYKALGYTLGSSYEADLDGVEIVRLWVTNLCLFAIGAVWLLCLLLPPYPRVRLWKTKLQREAARLNSWEEHQILKARVDAATDDWDWS